MAGRLVWPEAAAPLDASVLTPSQIHKWRTEGYLLIDGIFPSDLIDGARAALTALNPGSLGTSNVAYPTSSKTLNSLLIHPRLVSAGAALLGSEQLRMTQSIAWSKSSHWLPSLFLPRHLNHDQRMHMDYPNHFLTHPPPWESPEALEAIIYLDDWQTCGGATAVVPKKEGDGEEDEAYRWPYTRMPGVAGVPWVNDRATAEEAYRRADPVTFALRQRLYEREVRCAYNIGSVLFYRHDTWHRGTPLSRGAPARKVINLVFAKPETRGYLPPYTCDFIVDTRHPATAMQPLPGPNEACSSAAAMYWGLSNFLETCSVAERTRQGVPPPGDDYWTEPMLQAMDARFPRMDLGPYVDAAKAQSQSGNRTR